MELLNRMQNTLALKQEAMKTLKQKSKALQKGMEPRNAYKLGKGQWSTQTTKKSNQESKTEMEP